MVWNIFATLFIFPTLLLWDIGLTQTNFCIGILSPDPRLVDRHFRFAIQIDHARKLKFSSYIHLPTIKKMFLYRYAVQCIRGYYFLAWVLYFSFETY